MVLSGLVVDPYDRGADWELGSLLPIITLHTTSPGEGSKSRFKIRFPLNVCHF